MDCHLLSKCHSRRLRNLSVLTNIARVVFTHRDTHIVGTVHQNRALKSQFDVLARAQDIFLKNGRAQHRTRDDEQESVSDITPCHHVGRKDKAGFSGILRIIDWIVRSSLFPIF